MRHSRQFKSIVAAIMAIIAVLAGQSAWADGWSVDFIESTHTFVITRTNTASKEMVKYHTVSGSALGNYHYSHKSYTLTFNVGESTKTVTVSEYSLADVPLQFRYSGNNKLYYDFVVTDQTGTVLASKSFCWPEQFPSDPSPQSHSIICCFQNTGIAKERRQDYIPKR